MQGTRKIQRAPKSHTEKGDPMRAGMVIEAFCRGVAECGSS
jgi:hypothetical protein